MKVHFVHFYPSIIFKNQMCPKTESVGCSLQGALAHAKNSDKVFWEEKFHFFLEVHNGVCTYMQFPLNGSVPTTARCTTLVPKNPFSERNRHVVTLSCCFLSHIFLATIVVKKSQFSYFFFGQD
jgi:hypothetical protein